MINVWQPPAAVLLVKQHKDRMEEIRSTQEWHDLCDAWVIGKVCVICGKPAEVPHHPTLDLYEEIQLYYSLEGCEPYCHSHHRKRHAGWIICPTCGMELVKPGFEECFYCHLLREERETKNTAVIRTCICPHCNRPEESAANGKQKCHNCGISYDHSKHRAVLR